MRSFKQGDVDTFWKKRSKIADPRVATHFRHDDMHSYDIKLIRQYLRPNMSILDLGCGSCKITNALTGDVKSIVAVDKYDEFLSHCHTNKNIRIEKADLEMYKPEASTYDLCLVFGVLQYFTDDAVNIIYERVHNSLVSGGIILVKHASGIKADFEVNSFSEQIGDNYYSLYRSIVHDESLLSRYFNLIDRVDIYPPRHNPWSNTHYYCYVGQKKSA